MKKAKEQRINSAEQEHRGEVDARESCGIERDAEREEKSREGRRLFKTVEKAAAAKLEGSNTTTEI